MVRRRLVMRRARRLLLADRAEEAAAAFSRATALDPGDATAHFGLANALHAVGRTEAARAAFGRAAACDPAVRLGHQQLALEHLAAGDLDGARRTLAAGAALQPDDPELAHLAAAADGGIASRASDAYLERYFGRLAPDFDATLAALGYSPGAMLEPIRPLLGDRTDLDVLDAGCGTGLAGPWLRPFARTLTGVDLSRAMLARAGARGYDELVPGELTAYLRTTREQFDLIVATDVLIYFGDLHEPVVLMAAALRPGGLLAVAIEEHRGDDLFVLRPSGRWAHAPEHLRAAFARAGLPAPALHRHVVRTELGRPVRGLLAAGTMERPIRP